MQQQQQTKRRIVRCKWRKKSFLYARTLSFLYRRLLFSFCFAPPFILGIWCTRCDVFYVFFAGIELLYLNPTTNPVFSVASNGRGFWFGLQGGKGKELKVSEGRENEVCVRLLFQSRKRRKEEMKRLGEEDWRRENCNACGSRIFLREWSVFIFTFFRIKVEDMQTNKCCC